MNDTTALLEQLRIERPPAAAEGPSGFPRRLLVGFGILLVLSFGGGTAWLLAKSDGTAASAAVELEVDTKTRNVGASDDTSMLDASGYVIARRSATVASRIIGRVVEVSIEEGQRVQKGEIIARLDDTVTHANLVHARAELLQAEAILAASKTALDDALPIFQRNERQMAVNVISAQAFDTAKASFNAAKAEYEVRLSALKVAGAGVTLAEQNQNDTILRAPFAGIVTVKAAQAGEIVSPQSGGGGFTRTGIGTIVDMESREVEVEVSENFINRVRRGQPATIRLNAYPEWDIPARVTPSFLPGIDRRPP